MNSPDHNLYKYVTCKGEIITEFDLTFTMVSTFYKPTNPYQTESLARAAARAAENKQIPRLREQPVADRRNRYPVRKRLLRPDERRKIRCRTRVPPTEDIKLTRKGIGSLTLMKSDKKTKSRQL